MGISAAPFIANLFLGWYEYPFLMQRYHASNTPAGKRALIRFRFSLTFLDDLLSLNSPYLGRLLSKSDRHGNLHGIYPPELGLSAQRHNHLPPGSVPFLDLLLVPGPRATTPRPERSGFVTRLYDQRLQPAFNGVRLSRFVVRDSRVNEACTFNIFSSSRASSTAYTRSSPTSTPLRRDHPVIRNLEAIAYPRALLLTKLASLLAACPQAFYFQRKDTHPNLRATLLLHLRASTQPRLPPP
jgi:hypothetical protein